VSSPRSLPTRALILAAGRGSRIGKDESKPLVPVLGVPLLARTLFTLEKAGITDAYVVVGYEGQRVRREIDAIRRLGLRVHWIENERWRESNGVSVLAAEAALTADAEEDESFVLTMADHVFEAGAVRRLREVAEKDRGLSLLVDRRVEEVHDLEDATKVRTRDGRIQEIGKGLESFDAVDTGLFLATPALFRVLRTLDAGESPGPSLSDGVLRLAQEGEAWVVPGGDLTWQDVDTPADVEEAERKLLGAWPKPTDGPVSRLINRPISLAISRRLAGTGITPNQISVLTLIMGLLAGLSAAVGGYAWWLASGLLFQVASILDGTDGELAILTFRTSPQGAWVDTVCDNVSYVAFLLGLLVGVHRADLPPFYLWTGLAGLGAALLSLANINLYLLREGRSGSALSVRYGFEEGEGIVQRVMRGLQYLGKRDLLSFLAFVLALLGQLPLALPLFGVGATLLLLPATVKANISLYLRNRKLDSAQAGS